MAIAETGRRGEIRYLGEYDTTPDALAKLVRKLADHYEVLQFCYEAGPTGYGLYRLILALGHNCAVVAPSMTPRKPGERVKTNRRDAQSLARMHRAGELTAVWVPDATHEAVRDLVRVRSAAVEDHRRKRQQVSSFLLRHGRSFPGRSTTWPGQHRHLEAMLRKSFPLGRWHPSSRHFRRYEALPLRQPQPWLPKRATCAASTILDKLMSFLGLVPSERSTGTRRQGGITKTGNIRARRALIEAAWTYRHPAGIGDAHQRRQTDLPQEIRNVAWKAQIRLCARYRRLMAKGKRKTVGTTAIARELAAFMWDIAAKVEPATIPS